MLLFVQTLLVCIGADRIMVVSVFLSLDNAFKITCAGGAVYLCVFLLKILQYIVCHCPHSLGVGQGTEGVTLVFV